MSIIHATDFYKTDHRRQYPKGTRTIYSNLTARGSRVPGVDHVVFFGLQYFIHKYLLQEYGNFFLSPKLHVVEAYKRRLDNALGKDSVPLDHIGALHDLKYLPLRIKALPEGALVPLQVPPFTVENTHSDFAWLSNFIETLASATVWGPCTSATTAYEYRKTFEYWSSVTGAPRDFVKWQGHDFSFRGMFGLEAAQMSGGAHLLSFTGTDTIPAIDFLEDYYGADSDIELIGGSIPATEHSVMCAGGGESEIDTYRRLLAEVYPKGPVAIVSDTWDFWRVITEILPLLKDVIMARDGKLVIRPDSGDPVKILVGDESAPDGSPERKGLIECLWNIFGGTTTPQGYRVLDSHIGAIYGDSITRERQSAILSGLAKKKFASCNVVLGIGSYTYQYVTRDTYGFAIKSTYCDVGGQPRAIFKKPKTDSGKNSHKGLLKVTKVNGEYVCHQDVSREEEQSEDNELKVVLEDGVFHPCRLSQIRERIDANVNQWLKSL